MTAPTEATSPEQRAFPKPRGPTDVLPVAGGRADTSAPRAGPSLLRALAIGLAGVACGTIAGYAAKRPPPEETLFANFDPQSTSPGLLRSGWSGFEQTGAAGDTFAWCASTTCVVRAESRADGGRLVRVRVSPFRYPGAPTQTMTVFVNGASLGAKPLVDGMGVFSFPSGRAAWRKGENELRFDFAYAEAPQSKVPGSSDSRRLAAAFDWLEIAPLATP